MDASIVNVVLLVIADDLGMTVSSSTFISVAYLIPVTGLCLTLSKVTDCTDIRRMFLVRTALFSVASVECTLSPGAWLIILFRFVQELGTAFMVISSP